MRENVGKLNQTEAGLTILTEALTVVNRTGERTHEAALYTLKGALLLQQATPDISQAEASFQQALDIARSQQSKSLKLRATTSLDRLWQRQGKCQDAYDLLAPAYNWFTEGFDTVGFAGRENVTRRARIVCDRRATTLTNPNRRMLGSKSFEAA